MSKIRNNQGKAKQEIKENINDSLQKTEVENISHTIDKIMVLKGGSDAIHKTGNIARPEDDFICVKAEDKDNYIGVFKEGFGFINVIFKKSDVRPCTPEEIDDLNKKWFGISGRIFGKNHYDYEGNNITVTPNYITGKIEKVLDASNTSPKHKNFWGIKVRLDRNYLVTNSIMILEVLNENGGNIQTSTVQDIVEVEKDLVIKTLNSVFHIKLD